MPQHSQLSSQLDKFKESARELECDESETAFEEKLKKLAKAETLKKDEGPASE